MITLRKLQSLPPGTRERKLVSLLAEGQRWSEKGESNEQDLDYWKALIRYVHEILGVPAPDRSLVNVDSRAFWTLRQLLLDRLQIEQGDWDFQSPTDARRENLKQFPFSVWLEDLRSPFNVGSIFRTAEAYGLSEVFLSPLTPRPDSKRVSRSAMGSVSNIAWRTADLDELQRIWGDQPVFALELGGTAVQDFVFPTMNGDPLPSLVLVGSEELGLSPQALAWADSSAGRVTLPLYGKKASLNVGVAFGILASWWVK